MLTNECGLDRRQPVFLFSVLLFVVRLRKTRRYDREITYVTGLRPAALITVWVDENA